MATKQRKAKQTQPASSQLKAQRTYVERMKAEDFDFGLTVAEAFVRGIRDIGYKSTATALDELIDNAVQGEAHNIHVAFGDGAKPTSLAVLDDGHGMEPDMIRLAATWGGTHREGDRAGFGRYGYGLPSASISQGRRFSVLSRLDNGDFSKVTLDLDDLAAGVYTSDGRLTVPEPESATLPDWLRRYAEKQFGSGASELRTVVLIEKLDRLTWKTATSLERNLLQRFGITYKNYLRQTNLVVQGTTVEPIDPLFTTSGARFYDLDEDRAEALEPLLLDVKDEKRNVIGTIAVRYSYMPPTFQREDKRKERGKMNARFNVMKEHVGLIVLRNGRHIDVVTKSPWTTFKTYDRNWGVEIDFPPALDEEFSITTSKQQVVLSERIWEILREGGVYRAIEQLRKRFTDDNAKLKAAWERDEQEKRASEQAMEEAAKFKTAKPAESPERKQKAQEALRQEVQRRAKESGMPVEEVERHLEAETRDFPYKVEERSSPGAPFFRVEQRGGQKVLILNTARRFYADVYAGPDSSPRLRAALEVLLFVIGDSELDASNERQLFYEMERAEWSNRLDVTLDRLDSIDSVDDAREQDALLEEQAARVA